MTDLLSELPFSGCCDWGGKFYGGPSGAFFLGVIGFLDSSTHYLYRLSKNPLASIGTTFYGRQVHLVYGGGSDFFMIGESSSGYYSLAKNVFSGGDFTQEWEDTTRGGLNWIDVDRDHVYVINGAYSGGQGLVKFDFDGNEEWEVFPAAAGVPAINIILLGVAVDLDGNIAVVGQYSEGGPLSHIDTYPLVWMFDKDGNELWEDHGSLSDNRYLTGECCCFDAFGNLYVGYGHEWASDYRIIHHPLVDGDYTWVRKYNSAGSLQWEKTKAWVAGSSNVNHQRVASMEIGPSSLGNKLLYSEQFVTDSPFNAYILSRLSQFSGADHTTLDFDDFTGLGAGYNAGYTYLRSSTDRCHFVYDSQGYIYGGGVSSGLIYSPSGVGVGSVSLDSSTWTKRAATLEGRHPIFLP